ncbi:MAG: FAD-dependent oxidoreductase [Armatimonadia bacterium]|nr:FAD-dependent oxidoreductase [Armatimonadia bacterium]
MPTLTIDGQSVTVPEGTTILEAAREAGVDIPTLCYREGLPAQTACMVCVVRVDGGERLRPSCGTPVRDGMEVVTSDESILHARRMALELMLSDHLGDCLGPCQLACPAGMDIPLMIRQIVAGDLPGAAETVRTHIPLPAVLGRICPAPCEGACRRGTHDQPVAIRLLKRWVGDRDLARFAWRPEPAEDSGRRVAVVGAGPAGLTAAYYLRLMGHAVTVVDERAAPGGGLREIAAEELPPEVTRAESARVLDLGVDLQAETRLGRDITPDDLRAQFDAVLLAIGETDEETAEALGVPFARRGLEADRQSHVSPLEGVFVAGSAQSPSKLAVRAVSAGREAALSIDQHVRGDQIDPEGRPFNVNLGRLLPEEAARMSADASDRERIEPSGGEAEGFNDEEAAREGLRCLHCDCRALGSCRLRALGEAYDAGTRAYPGDRRVFRRDATHPAIIYEPGKCIACGLCVEIARKYEEPLGLTFIGRGFDVRTAVPFGEALADGLRSAAIEGAEACPTGAIVLRNEAEEADDEREDTDGRGPDEGI